MQAHTRDITSSTRPIARAQFGYDQARHLLLRAGFGGSPDDVRTLLDLGPEGAVDHLLNFEDIPDDDADADARTRFKADIMAPLSREARQAYQRARAAQDEDAVAAFRARRQQTQRADRAQIADMQRWWLSRMMTTPRPLQEKLTLFWHGHFATGYRTIENSYHMLMQNQLFRAHAAGSFQTLLRAITRDPAMLAYLDNHRSHKRAPNENLARELMELFSLGVGAYTEQDIKEGARALTGHTFEGNNFQFRSDWHDGGTKRILGKRGAFDGDGFVRAILDHPACAPYLVRKLYRFFVADIPDDVRTAPPAVRSVLSTLASTLRRKRYDIKPMLRQLLLSEHFYVPNNMSAQIKSPAQLVVGTVRALKTPARDLRALVDAMGLMGQTLFMPPSVAGWEGGRSWINTSTLFIRQNTTNYLLTGKKPSGFRGKRDRSEYDPTHLVAPLALVEPGADRNPDRVCEHMLRVVLGPSPTGERWIETERYEMIRSFMRGNGDRVTRDMLVGMLVLIGAFPEHQLC